MCRDPARYFAGKPVQLVHHRVKGFFELEDFTANVHRNFSGKIAIRNGCCNFSDVTDLASQVAGHEVNVVSEIVPRSGYAWTLGLAAELSFGSDFAAYARYFAGKCVQLVHHRVDS